METTITTPHPEKLKYLNKDLTAKINDSTEDLLKTTNQWSWWYSIRSQSVLKVLHQSRSLLYGKLCFLKEDFEKNAQLYLENSKKFMRLTSIDGEDTMLDLEEQKQQIEAQTELHRAYSVQQADYIAGNQAKNNMLVSDSELNMSVAEHIKSNDYLDAVRNSTQDIRTYPEKPELNFEESGSLKMELSQKNADTVEYLSENSNPKPVEKFKSRQVIYTQAGLAPDYYTAEEQLEEAMWASGENYASQYSNPTNENAETVTLSTTSKAVLKQPTYKQNILGHIGLDKVVWAGLVYGIALAGEILIFSSIFGLVFNFNPVKSMIAGLAPLLLSFGIGYSLYGTILNFTKRNNIISRLIKSSRFMLGALLLALLYAFSMGLLFKNTLDQDELLGQMAMYKQEQYEYDPDILDDDMSKEEREEAIRENGTKINEVNTRLVTLQEGWIPTVAKLTVALSSLVFLLFSGIMFGVLLLFLSAYKTQKAMKKIENYLPNVEAEFYSQKNVIKEVDNASNRILNWMGQQRFIEKMLAGNSTKETLFYPKTEEIKLPFSTNGKHHSEQVNIHF